MNEENKLLTLVKDSFDPTLDETLNKYNQLLDTLNNCQDDLELIKSKFPLNIEFTNNEELKKIITDIERASNYIGRGNEIDAEISNAIKYSITIIKPIYNASLKQKNKYQLLLDAIEKNNNPTILFDFIDECFNQQKITIVEAIKLNTFIAISYNNIELETEEENATKTTESKKRFNVLIEENDNQNEIENNLKELFERYEYPYNEEIFKPAGMSKMKKFAKIDNAKKVLDFFKSNNIKSEDFNAKNIKSIINIIVFYDGESINGINDFIKNNNCTLSTLLGFPSIFFKSTKEYAFKLRGDKKTIVKPNNSTLLAPVGRFDDFIANIELLKKSGRLILDENKKVTDESLGVHKDGDGFKIFLQESNVVITKNLKIMQMYGLISENELPNALMAAQGSHVEYILDRFIEAGLFNILKENNYYMHKFLYTKFRWYKIKLAMILGEKITPSRGKGLSTTLTNEDISYYGMKRSTENGYIDTISQKNVKNCIPHEFYEYLKTKLFAKRYIYREVDSSEKQKYDIYKYYFKLYEESVSKIFYNLCNNAEDSQVKLQSQQLSFEITKAFSKDFKDTENYNDIETDEYVKFIDNALDKTDNNTYLIYKKEDEFNPTLNIYISRNKFLRLCKLLKENNCWINNKMNAEQKTAIILSALLKDTIVTNFEYRMLYNKIANLVKTYEEKISKEKGRAM